jgi:hypothetical protein
MTVIARAIRRPRTLTLVLGDAVALILWAVLGLASHNEGVTVAGLLRNAGLIMVGWFAAALVLGTYRSPGVWRFLATWAIGITAGVILRAAILGKSWNGDEFTFLAVTLGVTLVLLAAWRIIAAGVARAARHGS